MALFLYYIKYSLKPILYRDRLMNIKYLKNPENSEKITQN